MQSDTYKFKVDWLEKADYQRIFDENPEARIVTISREGKTLVAARESWLKRMRASGLGLGYGNQQLNRDWGWSPREGDCYPAGWRYWWDSTYPDRLAAQIKAALDWKDNRIEVKVTAFK